MRTKNFWLIAIGHACSSIVIVTITVHPGPMLDDRGFSLETIGLIVGAYTGVAAVFTLIGGYLGDCLPIRLALFGFSAVQSAAVLLLAAPLFAGIMFDATQSYTLPMAVVAIVSLAGSSLFLFLGSPQSAATRRPRPANAPGSTAG